jgi:hypothetical protein
VAHLLAPKMSALSSVLIFSSGRFHHLGVAGHLAAPVADTTRCAAASGPDGSSLHRLQHTHQPTVQILMPLR